MCVVLLYCESGVIIPSRWAEHNFSSCCPACSLSCILQKNNRGKFKDSSQLLWFFISVSNPLRKGHSNYQNMLEWMNNTPVVACATVWFHSLLIRFKLLQLETPLSGFFFTATALKEDIKENLDEGQMRNRERKINFSLRKQHPILPGLKSDKGERGYYIQ